MANKGFDSIVNNDKKYIINTYNRFNLVAQSGKDAVLTDVDGKQYIDFSSGIGVNSLGFCNDKWVDAVEKQLHTLQHTSNLFYTTPAIDAAQKLTEITGCNKVFFCNSGAEANEAAIKIARKASFDKYGKGRGTVLSLKNSFHGRTMATLTATGQDVFHNYFYPFPEGFKYCDKNVDSFKAAISDDVCAFLLEMVQGEGGVCSLDKDFVAFAYDYCKKNDIVFIVDEVQTGVARTGKFLASEHFGITPDMATLAKGLGGGLPVGAVLAYGKYADVLGYSDHGTTFGANPVVCAGVCAVLDQVANQDFLDSVCKKAEKIKNALSKCEAIAQLSGLGLMIGIELKSAKAKDVANDCIKNGLLVLMAKDKIRLLPPLNIDDASLEKGIEILIKTLGD